MTSLKYSVKDLVGVIAVIPTPVKPGSDHWAANDVVNLEETERAVNQLIKDGVHGVMVNGTLGEMATLTEKEWKEFVDIVIRTVANRVPVFVGATTLNTRDTIVRAKFVREQKGYGLFLGRPMWGRLPDEGIVRFYQDVAEALPDMAIIAYDNPEAFKGPISTEAYRKLSEIPQVIGSKYIALTEKYESDLKAVEGRMRLLPIEADWYQAYSMAKEEALGCWSSTASCDPAPVLELFNALRRGDHEKALNLTKRIEHTYETFIARTDFKEFSNYNIALEKMRFNEAGYISAGPALPPYQICPENYLEGARETGRRWKALAEEIKNKASIE